MNKKKFFITIILIILLSIIFQTNISNAALQSNGGTTKAYNLEQWLKYIRNMEANGGTFGLNAEIDENTLLDKGNSNGLDVHMELNTEYGAVAILSASSYGNPENINAEGKTTTGNNTGVVMNGAEFVSAITTEGDYADMVKSVDDRYKNLYLKNSDENYTFFKGDAMEETKGWHNSGYEFRKLYWEI